MPHRLEQQEFEIVDARARPILTKRSRAVRRKPARQPLKRLRAIVGRRFHLRCLTLPCITKAARGGTELNRSETAVGFTLPWAGVTSFGFAQDRLCTLVSGLAWGL